MNLYEDIHYNNTEEHYHLGGGRYSQPNNQDEIFNKIIRLLKEKLPPYLKLRINSYRSVNIVDNGGRTYIYLNYYYHSEGWRVKITPFEKGKEFFKSFLKPLIESIK